MDIELARRTEVQIIENTDAITLNAFARKAVTDSVPQCAILTSGN
jgi:hypothetical protein